MQVRPSPGSSLLKAKRVDQSEVDSADEILHATVSVGLVFLSQFINHASSVDFVVLCSSCREGKQRS
jgi:hypothetical protein